MYKIVIGRDAFGIAHFHMLANIATIVTAFLAEPDRHAAFVFHRVMITTSAMPGRLLTGGSRNGSVNGSGMVF